MHYTEDEQKLMKRLAKVAECSEVEINELLDRAATIVMKNVKNPEVVLQKVLDEENLTDKQHMLLAMYAGATLTLFSLPEPQRSQILSS